MSSPIAIKEFVEGALQAGKFAVLATEGDGQPHASLVAVTPFGGFRRLIFATYRSTRKYRNLTNNDKVALFIDGREKNRSGLQEDFVLTVLGCAKEVGPEDHDAAVRAHLERHPDLESFLHSEDCALVCITVGAYQVVRGINDVSWWAIDDPASA